MNAHTESTAASHQIHFQMQAEPAALERALQVIRIRGFGIESMQADLRDGLIDLAMTVSGTRPISMLLAQLDKLHTVLTVAMESGAHGDLRRRA